VAGYDPKDFEEKWYAYWEERGEFSPPPASEGEQTFSIVIPPPNITGSLHMGHALNNSLQDILVRYQRMLGKAVLWVPGTDHAGIATQNVVERQLLAENLDRNDLGREGFVERVWNWRKESGGTIIKQLRRLGVSCDWSMERFTMDEGLSRAVREVFVSLYEEGLITRDRYLINWCPRCHTALSDIEVEHEDRDGNLWHLRYPLEDGSGAVIVATTRPETMLGDTAVAVHPEDERYKDLVGKNVELPVLGRKIPIIADAYVEKEFGSGAVKITPGHDPNDYEMGLRHELAMISVMKEDGTMSEEAGEYAGLTREDCRAALVERFAGDGTLVETENHAHKVGTCYRCHSVVEPMLSVQWFVGVEKDMAPEALRAVEDGRTRFVPAHWEKTYRSWMENIRPWCISRQLWWGHRIPAWYCDPCDRVIVSREDPDACDSCGGTLRQDDDVLDTWFSSALWPFSTMGWPDKTENLARFYPTSALVTGFDIIFFWVARMMMMGLKFMDEVPFRDIYIHALVRDAEGQKMSKSKGNVIDPLDIVDEFGADAFRFTLAAFAAMGRDVRLSEDRISGYRNFINKIWNAARFVEMNRADDGASCEMPAELSSITARWIRSRLAATATDVREALDGYRFNDAASRLYQFVWHEYCDWYIELSKVSLDAGEEEARETRAMLTAVLEQALRLLHPIAPFVTEEIWQSLPVAGRTEGSIMRACYPAGIEGWRDEEADAEVGALIEIVRAARNIRSESNIPPKTPLALWVGEGPARAVAIAQGALIKRLAGIGEIHTAGGAPADSATALAAGTEISIPIAEHVDLDAETARLEKEIAKLEKEIARLDKKLGSPKFLEKAPPEIVEKDRGKLHAAMEERDTLSRSLEKVAAAGGAN
jgi:valyl-tRNA synthetase